MASDTTAHTCDESYVTPYEFEEHLFDLMKNDPCDLCHSTMILSLIKMFPLCNNLLNFDDINDFFVNCLFSAKSNV